MDCAKIGLDFAFKLSARQLPMGKLRKFRIWNPLNYDYTQWLENLKFVVCLMSQFCLGLNVLKIHVEYQDTSPDNSGIHAEATCSTCCLKGAVSLQWRHNEPTGVSNHRRIECLFNRLFRGRSKKTSKLRVTGLCEGNSPMTGEFPTQRASNAEMFPFDDVIMVRFVYHATCFNGA